jgi:peptide alpha-N-acetyltransferase
MSTIYKASFVSLHVRKSNIPAISLYRDSLGFSVASVEEKYCAFTITSPSFRESSSIQPDGDGEDALSMRLDL